MKLYVRFLRFLTFFFKPKKHDFLRFLVCCTRFLEHCFVAPAMPKGYRQRCEAGKVTVGRGAMRCRRVGERRASRVGEVHVRERRRLRRRVARRTQARRRYVPSRSDRQPLLRTVEERTTTGLRRASARQPQVLRTIQEQHGRLPPPPSL